MTRYRAIIFDVDGTAVNSPKEALPTNRLAAAIDGLKPHYYLSAATGRSWTWVKEILERLDLEDPCIVAAGTQIRDPKSGKALWQSDMDPADIDAIMAIFKTIPDCRLLYNDFSGDEYFSGGLSLAEINFTEPVYFLNCIFVPEEEASQVVEKLSVVDDLAITLAVSQKAGHKDILITNRLATKEQAVAELLRMIGVRKESAIGVGDGHNDIELFRAVGRKVAMGNAVPELKELADEVIDEIPRDGFAGFLEALNP